MHIYRPGQGSLSVLTRQMVFRFWMCLFEVFFVQKPLCWGEIFWYFFVLSKKNMKKMAKRESWSTSLICQMVFRFWMCLFEVFFVQKPLCWGEIFWYFLFWVKKIWKKLQRERAEVHLFAKPPLWEIFWVKNGRNIWQILNYKTPIFWKETSPFPKDSRKATEAQRGKRKTSPEVSGWQKRNLRHPCKYVSFCY